MIEVTVPGRGEYKFEHLVLDLNGTIALDGNIIEGVSERLAILRSMIDILSHSKIVSGGVRLFNK